MMLTDEWGESMADSFDYKAEESEEEVELSNSQRTNSYPTIFNVEANRFFKNVVRQRSALLAPSRSKSSDYALDAYDSDLEIDLARQLHKQERHLGNDHHNRPEYLKPPLHPFTTLPNPSLLRVTDIEWQNYAIWLSEIIHAPAGEILSRAPTIRLAVFLHFYRLEISPVDIVPANFACEREWRKRDRRVLSSIASFVHVPLDENFSPVWWCSSSPLPPHLKDYGYSFICHIKQTYKMPVRLSKKSKLKEDKLNFTVALMKNQPVPLLATSDPKLQYDREIHIDWALRYITKDSKKVPHLLRVSAARTIAALVWPEEIVPGLLDKMWACGAALIILNMARQGEVEVHKYISMRQLHFDHTIIGQGAVGKVHLGSYNGDGVAIKVCNSINPAFVESEFRFEVALMCILRHPNILPCIGANTFDPCFFVSPYQSMGTLRMVIEDGIGLTWTRKVLIAYEVACGMNYLHRYHIIHRDIKPDNILLSESWNVRITDFGTSRLHGKLDMRKKDNMIGTLEWMAPEMYQEDYEYDEKVDVYSFGIVLYELFTGHFPYYELEKKYQIADHVQRGGRPIFQKEEIPFAGLRALMTRCWAHKASKRPSFSLIEEKLRKLLHTFKRLERGYSSPQAIALKNTLKRFRGDFGKSKLASPLNNESNLQVVNSGLGLPSFGPQDVAPPSGGVVKTFQFLSNGVSSNNPGPPPSSG